MSINLTETNMASSSPVEGILTISYIECMVKGEGWEKIKKHTDLSLQIWRMYKVCNEDASELWIIRPDGLRRAWKFRLGSIIEVGAQVVQFRNDDVIEELAIDEDAQEGKKPKPKLPPKN
jgi:hypothetical protein